MIRRMEIIEEGKNGSDPNDLIKEMEKAGFSPSQVRPFVFSIEIDKIQRDR